MRRAVRRLGLSAVALLTAACFNSASSSAPEVSAVTPVTTAAPATTATTVLAPPAERFEIEAFEVAAAEGPPESFQEVRTQVAEALDAYLAQAVLTPLRTGEAAGDLSTLFAGAAAEQLTGPDRAALVDEGLPPVAYLKLEKATASLGVFAGRGGQAGLVSARISVVVKGEVGGTPLVVERTGELFLGREGDAWKISGYQIRVSKDTLEGSATTAA